MARRVSDADDRGFTLLEVLVAVIQVGVMGAVITAAASSLVSSGRENACDASAATARTAALVFRTDHQRFPTTFAEMTAGERPAIELPEGVELDQSGAGMRVRGDGWVLAMLPAAGGAAPTFVCEPIAP